jgi:uncharacterized protein YndB with AHSA1/START domain
MSDDRRARITGGPLHSELPHTFSVERTMTASPPSIYEAWTQAFDSWFASPGALTMRPEVGAPFWFEVLYEGNRTPHYGRFTALEPAKLIELTWVTGKKGTDGAETVVRVELTAAGAGTGAGTRLRLTHGGFYDAESARRHADSWPGILEHLDDQLTRTG